ncbi:MAG TPA: thioredoxin domain-containing protein [Thermoanaerobaculia bacterium]|jgi:protein-disulfide isomerase
MTRSQRFFAFLTVLALAIPARADEVAAVVNGRPIPLSDVDAAIAPRLTALEQQIYALRKSALDAAVASALVEQEARKSGTSVEAWKGRLTGGDVTIAAADIEKAYAENAALFATVSPDEARERIRLELQTQARMRRYRDAVEALRAKASVEIRLEEPRLAFKESDASAPSLGAASAPVVITEFADFECPWCRKSAETVKQFIASQGDKVRLVYRHLPLENHANALPAARASYCAAQQDRFWDFHDALYTTALTAETPRRIAESLRLDLPKYDACVASEASYLAVAADMNAAKRHGITTTPTFLINGRPLRGAPTLAALESAVARELPSPATTTMKGTK